MWNSLYSIGTQNNQRNRSLFNWFNLRWACEEISPGFHLIWFIAWLNLDSLRQQTIQSHGMNGFGIRCQPIVYPRICFEWVYARCMWGRNWWELNHSITLERNVMDIRFVASAVCLCKIQCCLSSSSSSSLSHAKLHVENNGKHEACAMFVCSVFMLAL